jgi:hypothetical protein
MKPAKLKRPFGTCCALDQNGKRCRRPAVSRENYHGDDEIYSWPRPTWVRVRFCRVHARDGGSGGE